MRSSRRVARPRAAKARTRTIRLRARRRQTAVRSLDDGRTNRQSPEGPFGRAMTGRPALSATLRPQPRNLRLRTRCDLCHAGRGRPALISICAYVDARAMDEITILQAEVLKTLASPRRLEILHALAARPDRGRPPGQGHRREPAERLAAPRGAAGAGIVEAERDGPRGPLPARRPRRHRRLRAHARRPRATPDPTRRDGGRAAPPVPHPRRPLTAHRHRSSR